jgi:hypothetical protein
LLAVSFGTFGTGPARMDDVRGPGGVFCFVRGRILQKFGSRYGEAWWVAMVGDGCGWQVVEKAGPEISA